MQPPRKTLVPIRPPGSAIQQQHLPPLDTEEQENRLYAQKQTEEFPENVEVLFNGVPLPRRRPIFKRIDKKFALLVAHIIMCWIVVGALAYVYVCIFGTDWQNLDIASVASKSISARTLAVSNPQGQTFVSMSSPFGGTRLVFADETHNTTLRKLRNTFDVLHGGALVLRMGSTSSAVYGLLNTQTLTSETFVSTHSTSVGELSTLRFTEGALTIVQDRHTVLSVAKGITMTTREPATLVANGFTIADSWIASANLNISRSAFMSIAIAEPYSFAFASGLQISTRNSIVLEAESVVSRNDSAVFKLNFLETTENHTGPLHVNAARGGVVVRADAFAFLSSRNCSITSQRQLSLSSTSNVVVLPGCQTGHERAGMCIAGAVSAAFVVGNGSLSSAPQTVLISSSQPSIILGASHAHFPSVPTTTNFMIQADLENHVLRLDHSSLLYSLLQMTPNSTVFTTKSFSIASPSSLQLSVFGMANSSITFQQAFRMSISEQEMILFSIASSPKRVAFNASGTLTFDGVALYSSSFLRFAADGGRNPHSFTKIYEKGMEMSADTQIALGTSLLSSNTTGYSHVSLVTGSALKFLDDHTVPSVLLSTEGDILLNANRSARVPVAMAFCPSQVATTDCFLSYLVVNASSQSMDSPSLSINFRDSRIKVSKIEVQYITNPVGDLLVGSDYAVRGKSPTTGTLSDVSIHFSNNTLQTVVGDLNFVVRNSSAHVRLLGAGLLSVGSDFSVVGDSAKITSATSAIDLQRSSWTTQASLFLSAAGSVNISATTQGVTFSIADRTQSIRLLNAAQNISSSNMYIFAENGRISTISSVLQLSAAQGVVVYHESSSLLVVGNPSQSGSLRATSSMLTSHTFQFNFATASLVEELNNVSIVAPGVILNTSKSGVRLAGSSPWLWNAESGLMLDTATGVLMTPGSLILVPAQGLSVLGASTVQIGQSVAGLLKVNGSSGIVSGRTLSIDFNRTMLSSAGTDSLRIKSTDGYLALHSAAGILLEGNSTIQSASGNMSIDMSSPSIAVHPLASLQLTANNLKLSLYSGASSIGFGSDISLSTKSSFTVTESSSANKLSVNSSMIKLETSSSWFLVNPGSIQAVSPSTSWDTPTFSIFSSSGDNVILVGSAQSAATIKLPPTSTSAVAGKTLTIAGQQVSQATGGQVSILGGTASGSSGVGGPILLRPGTGVAGDGGLTVEAASTKITAPLSSISVFSVIAQAAASEISIGSMTTLTSDPFFASLINCRSMNLRVSWVQKVQFVPETANTGSFEVGSRSALSAGYPSSILLRSSSLSLQDANQFNIIDFSSTSLTAFHSSLLYMMTNGSSAQIVIGTRGSDVAAGSKVTNEIRLTATTTSIRDQTDALRVEVKSSGIRLISSSVTVSSGNFNVANGKVREGGNDLVPAGTIIMYKGITCPSGYTPFTDSFGRVPVGLDPGQYSNPAVPNPITSGTAPQLYPNSSPSDSRVLKTPASTITNVDIVHRHTAKTVNLGASANQETVYIQDNSAGNGVTPTTTSVNLPTLDIAFAASDIFQGVFVLFCIKS
eukprot:ANDGO_02922.mRNA.1 hypothetical protein